MSSPTVLLNNLVEEEENTHIDGISIAYITGDVMLGLNRLVFFVKIKTIFILLASAYSIFCCAIVFYTTFFYDPAFPNHFNVGLDSLHYILGVVLSSIVRKRLLHYYEKLQEFDTMIGCRPKTSASSVLNFIQMCIGVSLSILSVPYDWLMLDKLTSSLMLLPVRLLYIMDIHFYGHLLSLLVPRLRLINYYMEMSLTHHKNISAPKVDELSFKSVILESQNCQMKKLMDMYCMIISAYDILIDAIKWQFVMALCAMFISILSFSYDTWLSVIRSERPFLNVAAESAFGWNRLFPLFAPCVFADQIQEEVRRLRELLASRLYENKLTELAFHCIRLFPLFTPCVFADQIQEEVRRLRKLLAIMHYEITFNKPGRRVARALLALTEARDLSFSLLQIFDIGISLPFKFMGLLLTYLIILLQFEKVIHPSVV